MRLHSFWKISKINHIPKSAIDYMGIFRYEWMTFIRWKSLSAIEIFVIAVENCFLNFFKQYLRSKYFDLLLYAVIYSFVVDVVENANILHKLSVCVF